MWTIFVVGMLGGAARELLRWRQLHARNQLGKFVKPIYLAIAGIQILLCGGVAMIFAPLAPLQDFVLATAFASGVGFELIVKQASKLRIWSPEVKQGAAQAEAPDEDLSQNIVEFMRI
jgi:hypothetical protein